MSKHQAPAPLPHHHRPKQLLRFSSPIFSRRSSESRSKPLRLSLPERRSARLSLLPGRRKFPYSVPDPSAALPRHRTRLVDLLGRGCLRYGRRHFPPEPSASQPFPPVARSRRGPLDEAHEFPHLTAVPAIENRPKPDSRPPHPILFHPLSCSRHSRLSRRAPHHLLLLKRHTFTAPAEPRFQPVCRNHTHPDRPHMPQPYKARRKHHSLCHL